MTALIPPITRTIALVGLMGVGKSSIGRRLAARLGLEFRDADVEIEAAAGRSISEIFADFGEPAFREGERRVIARLLEEPPHVLATGGGALTTPETRALLKERAITVWLRADLEVLARRIARRDHRPLLIGRDPIEVLRAQSAVREPFFAEADIVVESGETLHHVAVESVVRALSDHLAVAP